MPVEFTTAASPAAPGSPWSSTTVFTNRFRPNRMRPHSDVVIGLFTASESSQWLPKVASAAPRPQASTGALPHNAGGAATPSSKSTSPAPAAKAPASATFAAAAAPIAIAPAPTPLNHAQVQGLGATAGLKRSIRPLDMTPPGYGNPNLEVTSGIIGGPVHAVVTGPGGMDVLQSVTWTVSGAMQSQTYQNSIGTTTPLAGSVTHTWGGGSVWMDTFSPFWNATPGNHTVSVSVIYNNGSTGSASITVNVTQPTVNSFWVINGPTQWNDATGFSSVMAYAANVTVPNTFGGQIAIIQTVSDNDSEVNQTKSGGQATHTMISPGTVLDNDAGQTLPTDPGYPLNGSVTPVAQNGAAILPAGLSDHTFLRALWNATTENGVLDVRLDNSYKDYLVYQSSGGIWVQIAETATYTQSGEEQWVGSFTAGHWQQVAAPSPGQATPLTGSSSLGWVSWNGYVAPQYTYWNPPTN